MEIYVKISLISIFSPDFQSGFYHIAYIDFTRIKASNTACHKLDHTKYLLQTYNIRVLILYSKLILNI